MDIRKVLVPVHGRKADEEAIKLAYNLVKKKKGKVHVVYIIEVKRTLPLDAEIESETQKAEAVLDNAEHVAEEADFEVDAELLQAREAGPVIVDEAVERGVDLIIMGTEYKRRFGEFDLGRAIPYVLKHAPCWVWVLREPITEVAL